MPFCSQCGNQVRETDSFCGRCGAAQPLGPGAMPRGGVDGGAFSTISPRAASVICYIPWVGWIAAIIVLAADRFRANRVVRFHAFQALYLFVAWLINEWVLRWIMWPFSRFQPHDLFSLVLFVAAVFMMVKASQENAYSLPVFGELAERSVAED